MNKTLHVWITGRVQGVFFRAETMQQARQLGLSGWVRNLMDGRVEVLASGPEQKLASLLNWLHQGPTRALVTKVESEYLEHQALSNFRIDYG